MKKYGGKYFSIVLKPNLLGQQRFIRDLIKRVNQIRLDQGLHALDSDDLDQGWQNMSAADRAELRNRKWEKQKAREKQ